MKPTFARLHVMSARDAWVGLIIRSGTAKSVCTLLWDRKKDTFTLGQWMRGRIEIETCDLSPDGQHFLYTAHKYSNAASQVLTWTAVSRTPYLKAVAYYAYRRSGGWFFNNESYCVPYGRTHADDRESPEVRRVESDPPRRAPYATRKVREGWSIEDSRAKFGGRVELVRPAGSGWDLRHHLRDGYRLHRGETVADTADWEWADIDNKRLVWAAKGCLWAAAISKDGIEHIRLLHDFNGMQFEPLIAPYAGGLPVPPTPPPPPAMNRSARKGPRVLIRKKPNRSRVRPDEEAHG